MLLRRNFAQLANTLRFLSGLIFIMVLATLTFEELMPKHVGDEEEENKSCWRQIINVDNWRNPKYVIWALVVPSALFGYFVPYVHIVSDNLTPFRVGRLTEFPIFFSIPGGAC